MTKIKTTELVGGEVVELYFKGNTTPYKATVSLAGSDGISFMVDLSQMLGDDQQGTATFLYKFAKAGTLKLVEMETPSYVGLHNLKCPKELYEGVSEYLPSELYLVSRAPAIKTNYGADGWYPGFPVRPVSIDLNYGAKISGYAIETSSVGLKADMAVACGPENMINTVTVLSIKDTVGGRLRMRCKTVADEGQWLKELQITFEGTKERTMLKEFCKLIIDCIEEAGVEEGDSDARTFMTRMKKYREDY